MNDPIVEFWEFRKMITPTIIRWIFAAGLLVIPVAAGFINYANAGSLAGPGCFMGGLICGVLLLPFWRIACELAIVAFTINDRLGEIAAELKKAGAGHPPPLPVGFAPAP